MFGLFNRLTLFLCFAFIISCKEDNRNPIYKDIPAKYNHIFKKLRSLNNTSIISVVSSNGLIDQLNLSPYSTDKKYVSMFSNYGIPGAEDQQFFLEYYHQTFVPVLYQFYEINYSIDFLN